MNQIKIITLEDVILHKGKEWREVLEFIRKTVPVSHLSDKNLIRLTKGAATIEQSILMAKLLFQDSKERPQGIPGIDYFFKAVDHSNFSLKAWLEAIVFFHDWLEKEGRKTPFLKMLGYLSCCEESPENKDIDYYFVDLVYEMLRDHGYIG